MDLPTVDRGAIVRASGQSESVLEPAPATGPLPAIIVAAGELASRRFVEFFTAEIRNPNTRRAYARAVRDFCRWCEARQLALDRLNPVLIASYIEEAGRRLSPPSVKQALAAIRMLC